MKKSYLKRFATTLSVATTLLACPNPANAATDMFLKLGDIKGESLDAKHPNEIEVLSWSWGESDGTAPRRNRNGIAVPDCVQDLAVTKNLDSATPDIIMDAVSGRSVPTATLTLRKAGKGQLEFLTLTLSNVTISSYSTGGAAAADAPLTENLTLHFLRMDGSYKRQKADGSLDAPITWVVNGGTCR